MGSPVGAQSPVLPTLSELDSLKIQVLNLQYALRVEQEKSAQLTSAYGHCTVMLLKDHSGLTQATRQLEAEITKKFPGFRFDITTGMFHPLPAP